MLWIKQHNQLFFLLIHKLIEMMAVQIVSYLKLVEKQHKAKVSSESFVVQQAINRTFWIFVIFENEQLTKDGVKLKPAENLSCDVFRRLE